MLDGLRGGQSNTRFVIATPRNADMASGHVSVAK